MNIIYYYYYFELGTNQMFMLFLWIRFVSFLGDCLHSAHLISQIELYIFELIAWTSRARYFLALASALASILTLALCVHFKHSHEIVNR